MSDFASFMAQSVDGQPEDPNSFASFMGGVERNRQARLGANLVAASDTNPDAYAKATAIGRQIGTPAEAVADNLAEGERLAKLQKMREALGSAPKLAALLADDPEAAKLSSDDFATLTRLESSMTAAQSFGRGVDLLQSMLYGTTEWAGEASGSRSLAEWGRKGRQANEAEAAAHGTRSQFLDIRGAGDAGQWAKETAAEQVPLMAPALLGSLGGAALGGAVAGPPGVVVGGLGGAFFPSLVLGVGETQGQLKQKDPNAEAPGSVLAGGVAIAFLDSVVPGKIGGRLASALGREAAETVTREGITAAAKSLLKGAGVEGATEAAQEVIGEAAAAHGASQDIDWKGLGPQMVEAAAAGFFMGGTFEAGAHGFEKLTERQKAADAKKTAGALSEAVEATAESKLAARSPDRFGDLIRQIAGEGRLHLPADQLDALYQSGEIDAGALEGLGIADQLPEALAAGGDVLVDPAAYLQTAAKMDPALAQRLVRITRRAPSDMTLAEAESYEQDPARKQDVTDLMEALSQQYESAAPGQIIVEQATEDLVKTGRYSESQARTMAELVRERAMVRAADRGISPEALWLEERPQIIGPAPRLPVDDLDLVLERVRSGNEVKASRWPVLDIFKQAGGVKPGSELAQELAAMGITPKAVPGLYRQNGIGAADRIIVNEHEVLHDNGIKADASGNGYADHDSLMQAVAREWAGDPLQTQAERERAARLDEPVRELRAALEAAGIDPAAATKADVLRLMQRPDLGAGAEFNQEAFSKDAETWAGKITALRKGAVPPGHEVRLGRTYPVLRIMGFPKASLVMRAGKIRKAMGEHPEVTMETWSNLPHLISDPLLIFPSGKNDGSFVVAVDAVGSDGSPIIVPILADSQNEAGDRRNVVLSVYGKGSGTADADGAQWVARMAGRALERGEAIYSRDGNDPANLITLRSNSEGRAPQGRQQHEASGQRGRKGKILSREDVIKAHGGVFYQPDGSTGRGAFSINSDDPTRRIIWLFERANLSTFLHESGHQWLFEMIHDLADSRLLPEARARITRDLRTVMDWLGVKIDVATASPEQILAAMTVEQHERFARGTEAWAMEGKAPSLALRDAFQRFSAWLIRIYKKVARLDVKLSPEIRRVMDRLVASDAAIEQARRDSVYKMPSNLLAVATKAERAEIEAAQEQAALEAKAELQGRVMRELARERLAWWQEERAKVRAEVEAAVRQRPAYRVVEQSRGTGPDGQPLLDEAGEKRMLKLDRNALVAEYGEEIVKLLPTGVTAPKGGINHHILAGMLGLPNGDALRLALMDAKVNPLRATVERETDAVMRERHGDMVTDGRIAEDAADIVARGRSLEAVALQAKLLKRMAGRVIDKAAARKQATEGAGSAADDRARVEAANAATDQALNAGVPAEGATAAQVGEAMAAAEGRAAGLQRTAQRAAVKQVRNILSGMDHKAIREAAATFLATRRVEDAIDANRYRWQAKRHERRAEIALAARDYDTAYAEKQQQLLNMELEAQARAAKQEVEKFAAKARRLNKPDAKLAATADQDFFKAARAILAHYGLARADSGFDVKVWLKRLKEEDPAGAADIEAIIDNLTSTPAVGRVATRILPSGQRVEIGPDYRQLPLAAFRDLRDGIKALMTMGANATSAKIDGERVAFEDIERQTADQLEPYSRDRDLTHMPSDAERNRRGLLGILASWTTLESWARIADGGVAGVVTRAVVRPVFDAIHALRAARREQMEKLREILAPAGDDLARPRVIQAPDLAEGFRFENKGQLIHAILHTGNDSNMKKLIVGWKWGQLTRDGGFDRSRWDAFMTRMWNDGIVTQADMDMVQAIWDRFEVTKPAAQKAHREMYGYNFKEIEARPVKTPWGDYRGGYAPALTEKMLNGDGARQDAIEALNAQQIASAFPAAARGFTKERAEDYAEPLMLDLLSLPAHLNKVLLLSHVASAVRQTARLVNRRTFREIVGRYDPTAIDGVIWPALQRAVRQTVETPAMTEGGQQAARFARHLRSAAGLQAMCGNLLNAAQQVTGISSAATLVGPGALARSLVTVWRNPESSAAAIMEKSPLMRERMDSSAYEASMEIEAILKDHTLLQKGQAVAQKYGYFAQQIAQNAVDRVVWWAAYDKALGQGVAEAEAIQEADSVVRRTQGSFDPESIAAIEAGTAWTRLFTQFLTYFLAQGNLIASEAIVALRTMTGRDLTRRMAAIYVFTFMIPAVVAQAIMDIGRGEFGGDDDDGGWLGYLSRLFFLSQLRFFAAMVPVAGQVAMLPLNLLNDKQYDDRLASSPGVSFVESGVRGVVTVGKALGGDGDASRATGDALNLTSLITGIPTGFIRKPLSYFTDIAEGDSHPRHLGNVVSGVLTGQDGTAR